MLVRFLFFKKHVTTVLISIAEIYKIPTRSDGQSPQANLIAKSCL